jgi:hypothetical protein
MKVLVRGALFVLGVLCASRTFAQDTQPAMPHHHHVMEELFPANEASGTSWVPQATPMMGAEGNLGGWHLMIHGSVFGQVLI